MVKEASTTEEGVADDPMLEEVREDEVVDDSVGLTGEERREEAMVARGVCPRIERRGTPQCRACQHPEHDDAMWRWWRGEINGEEAAARMGVEYDTLLKHVRRHVPNAKVLRWAAGLATTDELEKLIRDLQAEAAASGNTFGRVFLIRQNLAMLRASMLALTRSGFRDDPQHAQAIRAIAREVMDEVRELDRAQSDAEEQKAVAIEREQGSGWEQLRLFQEAVKVALAEHPKAWRAVLDKYHADGGQLVLGSKPGDRVVKR